MDYLNPKNRKWHLIRLFSGYILIASAVAVAVVVLFYLVIGFSYKDGVVVRNGMLFLSSTPGSANITLNGQQSGTTDQRIITEAGNYNILLSRPGYRSWQRSIDLVGGTVQRYNYPLLIPDKLTSTKVASFDGTPSLITESPNDNWLLVGDASDLTKFTLFDMSNPPQLTRTDFTIPPGLLTLGNSGSWKLVEWANDNQHILLEHELSGQSEYILLDTQNPSQSVNLETTFGQPLASVSLVAEAPDQFWFYDPTTLKLDQASLSGPTVTPFLSGVLAFKDYAGGSVVYATKTKDGRVNIVWRQDGQDNVIERGLSYQPAASDYLINLAQYNGDWYLAVGETSSSQVVVYEDPLNFISNNPGQVVPADWVMKINNPSYLQFSANTQFLLAESGRSVVVFNALYHTGYNYSLDGLDAPQTGAFWMDGYHLLFTNNGQLNLIDFDGINQQTLVANNPAYQPFFSLGQEYLFTTESSVSGGKPVVNLEQTPLRLPADI